MSKRRAVEVFMEEPMRSTKRARIANTSQTESSTRACSPGPWPSIGEYHRSQDVERARRRRYEMQARKALDRSDSRFRQARQEYIRFRRNRLPSPAPSDDGSEMDSDSDADEFGYAPLMFNLDNEDPEVEDVFDAAFVRQLREGIKRRTASLAAGARKKVAQWPAVIPDHHTITRWGVQSSKPRRVRPCNDKKRHTRQSRQRQFYELDCFGNARLVT